MSLERAADESVVVRFVRGLHNELSSRAEPLTRRLSRVDGALVRVVRGSRLYSWFTADPDPDPIVIDLRETYAIGPLLAVLDRVVAGVSDAHIGRAGRSVSDRLVAAPARAFGFVCCLGFAASLLGTVAEGTLGWPVYGFHALGLIVGLLALRDHRDVGALAESPVWGAVLAVVAPPAEAGHES